jgi:hypothetical protein
MPGCFSGLGSTAGCAPGVGFVATGFVTCEDGAEDGSVFARPKGFGWNTFGVDEDGSVLERVSFLPMRGDMGGSFEVRRMGRSCDAPPHCTPHAMPVSRHLDAQPS